MEWFRYIRAAVLILVGLVTFIIGTYGVYHYKYVLNRMHAAALGDTLGILFLMAGVIVGGTDFFTSLKLALVVGFMWLAGPVSTHVIGRLEVRTGKNLENEVKMEELK